MEKRNLGEMLQEAINEQPKKIEILSIEYNDMGSESVIILHARRGEGRLMRLLADGKPTDDLCPCCMTAITRAKILGMIKDSHVKKVVWVSNYAHSVQDYFPELHNGVKLSETEYSYSI